MDRVAIFALLKSCAGSKSLRQAKLLHQKAVTLGLQDNIPICKNLINVYITCQDFRSADQVFRTVENPLDITLWNGLMAAYTKNFMFHEALELFERLLNFPYLTPDSYTYPSVLKACGGIKDVRRGRMLHTHVMKTGFLSDVVVASSLVGLYAKCDMFGSATLLFDELPERDVACWNTVMSCFYQSGQYEKALELFDKMKGSGFRPDSVTFTTAISACARLVDMGRGEKIRKEMERGGFVLDGFVSSALVDMYGKCGHLDKAKEIFEGIQKKSLVSWNAIITGYSLKGDTKSCIGLLFRMCEENFSPTSTTFSSLLMACSRSAQLQHGKFIHGYIVRNNVETDIFINTALVDFYFKCGCANLAESVFQKMPKTNVVAWNVMISGYVGAGCYFEALKAFNDMEEVSVKPDAITLTSALTACSQLAALEKGKEIHECVKERKLESNEIVMGALLDMYSKCGAVNEARIVFDQLPQRDLISWTSMIMAYGSHGQAFESLKLFGEMLHANVQPDRITFLAVVSACSHAGLVDEGCHYFSLMVGNYGFQPTIEDYSCFIDLLGRAGRLYEAYDILQRDPFIREDVGLLSTLLCACHMHREVKLGEKIAESLIEKDPSDPSTYIVLAKLYASTGRWNEVQNVRLKMKDLGLRKNPGCSWIEVGSRIKAFFVGDNSFPQANLVSECLSMINSHIENDGIYSTIDDAA